MSTRRSLPGFTWPGESWHPLFYDLSFVAVVLVLADAFSVDHTRGMAAWLALVFAVLWLLWFVTMLFERRQPIGALRVGVLTVQMAMLLVAAMAADDTIEDNSVWFGAMVAAALLLSSVLVWPGRREGDRRPFVGLIVAGVAWLVSLALWSSWLVLAAWSVGLAAMVYVAWTLIASSAADHQGIGRRLGELTVVVIGESFLKVGLAAGEVPMNEVSVLGIFVVFIVSTFVWWDYFIGPGLAEHGAGRTMAWATAQWTLHLALIWLAVGLSKILVDGRHLTADLVAALVVLPTVVLTASLAARDLLAGERPAVARALVHVGQALVLAMLTISVWFAQWPGNRVAALSVAAVVGGGALLLATSAVRGAVARDHSAGSVP